MLTNVKYKQLFIGITLQLILSLYATSLFAGQTTLSWVPPSTNADGTYLNDLAGYKIYYGTESGNYLNIEDVGNVTNYQINNLTDGVTHFFTVTAYDTLGNEGGYSKEVVKFIQFPPIPSDTSENESGYSDEISEPVQSLPAPSEVICDNAAVCRIVEVQVSSGSDDAEEYASGEMKLTSSDLELTYDRSNQVVGIRFNQVEIPQGATITNAYIQFQVDETNSNYTYLTIQGEDINNAKTFTSESWNISSRPLTDEAVNWEVEPWTFVNEVGVDQQTPDISFVIQEIVDRAGWTSGNSLAIIITGSGERKAESYNGDQAGAPVLYVEFDTSTVEICDDVDSDNVCDISDNCPAVNNPGQNDADNDGIGDDCDDCTDVDDDGVCDPDVVDILVSAGSDDAEEYASGKMNSTSSDLELIYDRSTQVVGIRFNQVEIPQGATITNAYIQFQVDETNSEYTYLMIQGENDNHAQTFTSQSWNISSRPLTDEAVNWEVAPWTSVGEAGVDQQTPDISFVIQEIVDRAGWTSGNSLAIIITGTGERKAESYNGDQAGAPVLHVEFVPWYGAE